MAYHALCLSLQGLYSATICTGEFFWRSTIVIQIQTTREEMGFKALLSPQNSISFDKGLQVRDPHNANARLGFPKVSRLNFRTIRKHASLDLMEYQVDQFTSNHLQFGCRIGHPQVPDHKMSCNVLERVGYLDGSASNRQQLTSQIASFMGPTWGPPGADRTQLGPMLATWTLLSEMFHRMDCLHS